MRELIHIKKLTSTVYHPEANVLVRKGTLTKIKGCFNENEIDGWDKYLPYYVCFIEKYHKIQPHFEFIWEAC